MILSAEPLLPSKSRCENVACDGCGSEKSVPPLDPFQTNRVNGPSPTIRTSLLGEMVTVESKRVLWFESNTAEGMWNTEPSAALLTLLWSDAEVTLVVISKTVRCRLVACRGGDGNVYVSKARLTTTLSTRFVRIDVPPETASQLEIELVLPTAIRSPKLPL